MPYSNYLQRGSEPTYDSTAATHPLIPEEVQREIIRNATQMSAVARLMKKRPMRRQEVRMPVLDTKATAYFVTADTGLKQTTAVKWRNVFLNAEEIAAIVVVPINLVKDVDYPLWDQIRPEVEEAIGRALDAAVLFGTNKPSSWPTALATAAISAGNTVTQGAGVDVAADVNNVLGSVEADGYSPNGVIMRTSLKASFRGLRSTTNEFIFQPNNPGVTNTTFGNGARANSGTLFDLPAEITQNGVFEDEDAASANAVQLIAGDWSQAILGVREDVDVEFFREGIIQDASGDIQSNLLQQDLVAARFTARYAFAVPNPINRIQTTEASRYPFGVLRMAA